ncbi:MAG: 2-phosphosulfolactate phosphatase, partial [Legionellales bacterium]|nr:2-phosphosulfolactate phosphatase [Legionellales bacterium]
DLVGFLKDSSHRRRLGYLHLEEDIEYCLSYNKTDVVPVLSGIKLVDVKKEK